MAVEIRLLGRVDALVDGRSLPLRGSKQRAVLAMLALRANRTVGADVLIDGLWGDARRNRRQERPDYVSQLRKALASDDSGRRSSPTVGVRAQAPGGCGGRGLLRAPGRAGAARGRAGDRRRRGQGALELWQGAPLADVAEEPFAGPEIRRLEELHLRAIELTIDAGLAAARHARRSAPSRR